VICIPSEEFPFRLIFDSFFYEDVLKNALRNTPSNPPWTSKLTVINDRAKGCSRNFNTISQYIFDKIIEKDSVPRNRLRAMFMPVDEHTIEQIEDEIERTIKHAINLASLYKPHKALIMTSNETRAKYESNNHFKSSHLVLIASGEECLALIDFFYKKVERA